MARWSRALFSFVVLICIASSANAQFHQLPRYTIATLPANPSIGAQAVVTDGGCAGATLVGDGTNWRALMEKEQKIVNVACPPYNADTTGAVDARAALASADTAAGATGTLLLAKGAYKVSSNLTLTSSLRILKGAILSPDAAVIITLSSPPEIGLYQAFSTGGGTISFSGVLAHRYPQWWGAKGDNVDDTAALAAMVASVPAGQAGSFSIPFGTYNTTATINVSNRGTAWYCPSASINGVNLGRSVIAGSFNGSLVTVNSVGGGQFIVENCWFNNSSTGTSNTVLDLTSPGIGNLLHNVTIGTGYRGIVVHGGAIQWEISGFNVTCSPATTGGIGIYSGGGAVIRSGKVSGCDDGIRVIDTASETILQALDIEVNKTGIRFGVDETGANNNFSGSLINVRGEANDTFLYVQNFGGTMAGVTDHGSTGAPSGQSLYSLRVAGGLSGVILNSNFGGGTQSVAAVRCESTATLSGLRLINTTATNGFAGGKPVWDCPVGLASLDWDNINAAGGRSIRPDDATISGQRAHRDGVFQRFSGIDYTAADVEGKNVRHKAMPVAASATSLVIVFFPSTGGQISSATATAGGTLPNATYFYCQTVVSAHGEGVGTCGSNEKSATTSGANNSVTIVLSAVNGVGGRTGYRRRIYRGTATQVYDGYFERPLNDDSNFVDTGSVVFTELRSINLQTSNDMIEPDANYNVFVACNWNCGWWVTGKATTGYTIQFNTPAPSGGGTVDTFYVR